ncbi:GtrA family protein [Streptomyces sp. NPDC060223]|uniref:GtrA family protein n=1 Tax=unclassified Streptomyces TaxID=2593676 RepID=UPI00363647C9
MTRTGLTRPISRQILAFALVGVVNTLTYYGFYLLLLTRLPYLAAHILASVLSMIGSFFLNARFTYRTRPTLRKFLLFPLTNATNFVVTTAGVYVVVGVFHVGDRIAPLLASVVAIPVTFVVSRMIMLPKGAPATATPASQHAEPPPRPPALPAPPARPPAR